MMAEISSVPCSQTASTDCHSRPCCAKNASKQPIITPLRNSWKPVPNDVSRPMAKTRNETKTLFIVICRNMVPSGVLP